MSDEASGGVMAVEISTVCVVAGWRRGSVSLWKLV
jgi:hypothetical protein